MILVDTSVWIEIFRHKPTLVLVEVAELDEIVTCLPIVQEVLQGVREERAHRIAREALLALPILEAPPPTERFLEAAELYRAARRSGLTVRSGVDCLIAACALRHHLTVAHRDRDFDLLARVCPLSVRSV
ncbi:MAG: PIN domain-containing protein [Acidobacteria bacterium]|nr:PIN domain-containing protein [Acidobacteriota bacterium]